MMDDLQRIGRAASLTRAAQRATDARNNLCISHTRQMIAVLDALGYESRPLVVRLLIENAASATLKEDPMWSTLQCNEQIAAQQIHGAYETSLGFTTQASPGHWAGHLVAEIPSYGAVIDISIDQIHEPLHDIIISGPVIFLTEWDDVFRGPDELERPAHCLTLSGGARVWYVPFRDDESFIATAGWRVSEETARTYDEFGELIREQLDAGKAGAFSLKQ